MHVDDRSLFGLGYLGESAEFSSNAYTDSWEAKTTFNYTASGYQLIDVTDLNQY